MQSKISITFICKHFMELFLAMDILFINTFVLRSSLRDAKNS